MHVMPITGMLVASTTSNELLSFMDGFEPDMKKVDQSYTKQSRIEIVLKKSLM